MTSIFHKNLLQFKGNLAIRGLSKGWLDVKNAHIIKSKVCSMMQIRFVIRREKNVRARDTRAVTKDDEEPG